MYDLRLARKCGLTPITDTHGNVITIPGRGKEPEPGSIVLTQGQFGTAWQRSFDDGMWHRVGGGRPRDWAWMLQQNRVFLSYNAPKRG